MKERVQIERFVRRIFLRKSLYFSLLSIFSLGIIGLGIAVLNLWYLPDLRLMQYLFKVYIILTSIVFIIGPIRLIILALLSAQLPDRFIANVIKNYDGGRFLQSLDLKDTTEIGTWTSSIAARQSNSILSQVITSLKFHWTLKYISIGTGLAILTMVIFYKPIETSTTEIFTGNLRTSLTPLDLPDSILVTIHNAPKIEKFVKLGYELENTPKEVLQNSVHQWKYKGRNVKSTWIVCDSIINVNSWLATISPPDYTGIRKYTASDTLIAIEGSKIKVAFKGVLTQFLKPIVSRETFNDGYITLTSDIKQLIYKGLNQTYTIPVFVREDLKPTIEVVTNTYDSLALRIFDDFQINNILINDKSINDLNLVIAWGDEKHISVTAIDNLNQRSIREIRRPQKSLMDLRVDITNSSSVRFQKFSDIKEQLESSKSTEKKGTTRETRVEERHKIQLIERVKQELKDVVFENELDELWEVQKLINALELVSRETNSALDSLINESIKELEDSKKEGVQDELKKLKALEKEGQEREDQAKESAEKLKQLLAESTVDIQIDNIERIKRLLKNSWKTSVFQEVNKAIASGSKYREQRSLILIQKEISDSLDALLITDPMLGMLLNEVSTAIDGAVNELESAILMSKNIQVKTAYMVTALNDLNAVLYDILESEKMSLANAKKQCKKGKPGKTGKPSKGGKKPSPIPSNEEGKKPGKKGEPRKPGEQGTKPGENGKGAKELLKEIDNKLGDSKFPGGAEEREVLELLKREILFGSPRQNESQEDFENRLWETLKSEFNKDEQGDERKSNSGDENTSGKGIEIKVIPSNNRVSDLPLPVLKKK